MIFSNRELNMATAEIMFEERVSKYQLGHGPEDNQTEVSFTQWVWALSSLIPASIVRVTQGNDQEGNIFN